MPSIIETADQLAIASEADVFLYNAPIERGFDRKVIASCLGRRRRPNVIFIIVSEGGDPHAAYRISRCLQNHYTKVTCIVSGYCKSAGTLVALGAHDLVFWEHGELGPLDVQMAKKDELWESQSGLTVTSALSALNEKAYSAFESFFLATKYNGRGAITLRTASRMAVRLTVGLYSSIFAQIDPMHIGEAARSISIARQYGARLNRKSHNLKRESLDNLISGFVSHGFVIDRQEAADLFINVRGVNEAEETLLTALGDRSLVPLDTEANQTPFVDFLSKEIEETNANDQQQPVSEHTAEPGVREVAAATGGGPPGNGNSAGERRVVAGNVPVLPGDGE